MTDHASGRILKQALTSTVTCRFSIEANMDPDNHSRTRSICISYPQPAHSKVWLTILLFYIFGLITLPSIHEKPSQLVYNLNTPPKLTGSGSRSTRQRATRSSNLATTPAITTFAQPLYQQPLPILPTLPVVTPNPPRAPLPTTMQAYQSTYASRLKTACHSLSSLSLHRLLPHMLERRRDGEE